MMAEIEKNKKIGAARTMDCIKEWMDKGEERQDWHISPCLRVAFLTSNLCYIQ